jgi:DNA-binding CsgD family transcriptional regulator
VSYAHTALEKATAVRARVVIPDILELLAQLPAGADGHAEAARLLGAADALRASINIVRFKVLDPGHAACVSALRDALGDEAFDQAWADGSALSIDEATAYAQRGRGERKRPTSGWASLTPTERDVVRLVGEGLSNKDVAARLFVSPRTVESHLSHVYTKLGLSSRVQLAQEAARHAD